jgi:NhaP-type Na+/H+ or K+/H+ antiporter
MKETLFAFASFPILGIAAQWLSWRVKVPSILFLLITGIIVGPILNLVDPDVVLGPAMFPMISMSVAIILFEGGLSLKISGLKHTGKVVRNLVTIGVIVTAIITSIAAYFLFDLEPNISILLGAILVVTGPTVIIPLLKQIRLKPSLASVLRWEGIIIDPIGASFAVLIFEIIMAQGEKDVFSLVLVAVLGTILAGFVTGLFGAALLIIILKKRWIPEFLQETMTLVIVILVYSLSEVVQAEAGLWGVTILGIVLANQSIVTIKQIVTFKENLTILLLSSLFILLAARVQLSDLVHYFSINTVIFMAILIFITRPLGVYLSTQGSALNRKEILFLSFLAPRGIVAAAVASLFSIKLTQAGIPGAAELVPLTFIVLVCTVVFYGFLGSPFAKYLQLVVDNKKVLFIGAQSWLRKLAHHLIQQKVEVVIIDSSRDHILGAKDLGVKSIQGSILSTKVYDEIEFGNYATFIAATDSDEINVLSNFEYSDIFGTQNVFRIEPSDKFKVISDSYHHGRFLFSKGSTSTYFSTRLIAGAKYVCEEITEENTLEKIDQRYRNAVRLFIIYPNSKLYVCNQNENKDPSVGDRLVLLAS